MRYAIKDENGVVIDVILADADFMAANYAEGTYELVPEPTPPAPPPDYAVSKRVFYNRLEALVPDLFDTLEADSVDPAKPVEVRKALKKMLRNFEYTTYVQVDSADTQTFLSGLVALGYISAANQTAASAPAAAGEVWNGPR
jgi:hypothetical protein